MPWALPGVVGSTMARAQTRFRVGLGVTPIWRHSGQRGHHAKTLPSHEPSPGATSVAWGKLCVPLYGGDTTLGSSLTALAPMARGPTRGYREWWADQP